MHKIIPSLILWLYISSLCASSGPASACISSDACNSLLKLSKTDKGIKDEKVCLELLAQRGLAQNDIPLIAAATQ